MIDICVDELNCIGLSFNVKKSYLLRFGSRYMRVCEPITLYENKLTYVHKTYILELQCVQVNVLEWICVQQNPISILVLTAYFSVARYQNELIVLHLVSAYCKPYLLYDSECMDLNVTQIRSILHTWQTVVSHICHIKGADV